MNNISTHRSLILDLELFFCEHLSEATDKDTVLLRINNSNPDGLDRILSELDEDNEKTVFIVLLETSATNKIQKTTALFWRKRMMVKITKSMRHNGLKRISRFALFPDADTARVVYELGSDASRYAEYNLLPQQRNRFFSLLTFFFGTVLGCSPRIDAVAIVGRK